MADYCSNCLSNPAETLPCGHSLCPHCLLSRVLHAKCLHLCSAGTFPAQNSLVCPLCGALTDIDVLPEVSEPFSGDANEVPDIYFEELEDSALASLRSEFAKLHSLLDDLETAALCRVSAAYDETIASYEVPRMVAAVLAVPAPDIGDGFHAERETVCAALQIKDPEIELAVNEDELVPLFGLAYNAGKRPIDPADVPAMALEGDALAMYMHGKALFNEGKLAMARRFLERARRAKVDTDDLEMLLFVAGLATAVEDAVPPLPFIDNPFGGGVAFDPAVRRVFTHNDFEDCVSVYSFADSTVRKVKMPFGSWCAPVFDGERFVYYLSHITAFARLDTHDLTVERLPDAPDAFSDVGGFHMRDGSVVCYGKSGNAMRFDTKTREWTIVDDMPQLNSRFCGYHLAEHPRRPGWAVVMVENGAICEFEVGRCSQTLHKFGARCEQRHLNRQNCFMVLPGDKDDFYALVCGQAMVWRVFVSRLDTWIDLPWKGAVFGAQSMFHDAESRTFYYCRERGSLCGVEQR